MGRASREAEEIFYGEEMASLPISDLHSALEIIAPRLRKESVPLFSAQMSDSKEAESFVKVSITLENGEDGSPWYRSIFARNDIKGLIYQGPDISEAVSSTRSHLSGSQKKYPYCASLGREVAEDENIPLPSEKGLESEIIQIAEGQDRGIYSGEMQL